jgi:hypothetical protein
MRLVEVHLEIWMTYHDLDILNLPNNRCSLRTEGNRLGGQVAEKDLCGMDGIRRHVDSEIMSL